MLRITSLDTFEVNDDVPPRDTVQAYQSDDPRQMRVVGYDIHGHIQFDTLLLTERVTEELQARLLDWIRDWDKKSASGFSVTD